jgi:hypothetical protein
MFLEFDLVFYIIFQIFLFFKISEFKFQKLVIFKFGPGRSHQISAIFRKIGRIFKSCYTRGMAAMQDSCMNMDVCY